MHCIYAVDIDQKMNIDLKVVKYCKNCLDIINIIIK